MNNNLIPEYRTDKNGRRVLKHVRNAPPSKTATKLAALAPTLTTHDRAGNVDTEQGVLTAAGSLADGLRAQEKNQLKSLGAERDFRDAASIHQTLSIWAPRRKEEKSAAFSVVRSTLVKAWQEARLPDPVFKRIRPIEYPWSQTARDIFFEGGKGTLTLEHVKPVSYLINEVLFPAAENPDFTDEMFLDLLNTEHSRLSFTIVSKVEDTMINKAGYKNKHVESEDDFARYKLSGIDTSTFKALIDDERFDAKTMLAKMKNGKLKVIAPNS